MIERIKIKESGLELRADSVELIRKTISDAQRKMRKYNCNEGTSSLVTGPDKIQT